MRWLPYIFIDVITKLGIEIRVKLAETDMRLLRKSKILACLSLYW